MSERVILDVVELTKAFVPRRTLGDVLLRRESGRLVAVDDVSFRLEANQTLGIVGESGSGKSTLAKCLVRLVEPDSGRVELEGVDVLKMSRRELVNARRGMQMVYQDPYSSLTPGLTVEQAIAEAARYHGLVTKETQQARVMELLDSVGLPRSVAARRPRELSGGQRQRVAVARALAVQPEILIADEAVSALDVSVQAQILNLIARLQAELGLSVVFIAHQLSVIDHMADRVLVMYLGRIVESGPTSIVFREPRHPYTAGLLEAQPSLDRRATRRKPALQGEIPSPLNMPVGCRFQTRCPLVQDVCRAVDPPSVELSPGHFSACHVLAPSEASTPAGRDNSQQAPADGEASAEAAQRV